MYQALYRKWRPEDFDSVSGQPQVTSTLKNELMLGRLSHAYLFTGSRGTGKTSCAKILSKAVNCLDLQNGNPCNKCENCVGINNGSILDVIEIDAASNNGVDNIRDLREEVNFTPVSAKYRVYIIDEVHMLSIGAFNALLKTLEEPPAHVIFILATTEVYKLPATVLSRCQRFDFKRISPEEISNRLLYVAGQEGASLEPDAASLIARIADGGMRDALSLLDRCLVKNAAVTVESVRSAAGIAGTEHLFEFSDYIAKNDFSAALSLVTKLHNEACDIESLCTELTLHFRNLMVSKTVEDCAGLIICPAQELEALRERSRQLKLVKILECLDVLEQAQKDMKGAVNKKIKLETAVVRMCTPLADSAPPAMQQPAVPAAKTPVHQAAPAPASVPEPVEQPPSEAFPAPASSQKFPDGPFDRWLDVIEALKKYDMPLVGILIGSTANFINGGIQIISDNPTLYDFIRSDSHSVDLKRSVQEVLGESVKMSVKKLAPAETVKNPLADIKSKINTFNNT